MKIKHTHPKYAAESEKQEQLRTLKRRCLYAVQTASKHQERKQ